MNVDNVSNKVKENRSRDGLFYIVPYFKYRIDVDMKYIRCRRQM